jgi:uncharacterized protein (TIGR00369 family)
MQIRTHEKINQNLSGKPINLEEGHCVIELTPTKKMRADSSGLIHGGFIFSMADYAAMLAVNHPNVLLGESTFRFIKPAIVGDLLYAQAKVIEDLGKKRVVDVKIMKDSQNSNEKIAEGKFTCFIPKEHVLEGVKNYE